MLEGISCPFDRTKPCESPRWVDFRKSPWFSLKDFSKLLLPHTPALLYGDVRDRRGVIKPCFDLDVVPWSENLSHRFGYKFLPNFTNTVYALLYRVLAEPTVPIPSTVPDDVSWMPKGGLYYNPDIHVPEYLDNLKPHQKHRIAQAVQDWKTSGALPRSLEVFPKGDELLLGKCKPRIIWFVPPLFQYLLGPVVRQITFYMKELFNGSQIFSFGGKRFTLKFSCGLVASDLDDWVELVLGMLAADQIDWAGIFLGDDTFVLYKSGEEIKSFESDYSSYDSTQRDALQKLLRKYYAWMGVDPFLLHIFEEATKLSLKVRYGPDKKFSFKIALKECQTATGKPDTCIGNTLLNIHATIHFMLGTPYSDFGLVAKVVRHNTWHQGTFLKGFWCFANDGRYRWSYLPSLSIKLCKSFDVSRELNMVMNLNFSSLGYTDSPVLRILSRRFLSTPTRSNDFHVTRFDKLQYCASSLANFMIRRYGSLGWSLIQQLEVLLSTVPLGSSCYHPAWALLARRDYSDGNEKEWDDGISF